MATETGCALDYAEFEMTYRILKRSIDIVLSSLMLLILFPLFLLVMVILRFTAEGEVFYFQKRIGQHRRYFSMWKFATMMKHSPAMESGMITLRNDPRVTPIGKWLRQSKLNELPQIINVLTGDMSIVGPRPLVDETFSAYPMEVQNMIYDVKPGVTGIGSLIFRDEEKLISRSGLPPMEYYRQYIAPYKGQLEIWYHDHASISIDVTIIFLTAWQIIFPHSLLVHRFFKDLPPMPKVLKLEEEACSGT